MVIVLVKEARLIVAMNDLDFGIKDVAFEVKVFNRYGTFDWITNRSMEDSSYAYLHCDLLDREILTTNLHESMFVKVEDFGIEWKSKSGFEKGDMHVVITFESITIVSSIPTFQPKLVPMFFHMDSTKKLNFKI